MIAIILSAALRSACGGILAESLFRMLRIKHPAVRKAVWACVLASSLAMPLLQAYSIHVGVPIHGVQFSPQHIEGAGALQSFAMSFGGGLANSRAATPLIQQMSTPSLQGVSFSIYTFVVMLFSLRMVLGLVRLRRVVRHSAPFGRTLPASVRLSSEVETPWTAFSIILLPADAVAWSENHLSAVIAHESSHVRQRDFYLQLATRIYAAMFWFSPFAWWLQGECERLSEQTSDCAALCAGTDAHQYAAILLRFSTDEHLPAICMARKRHLRTRIETILTRGALLRLFDQPKTAALKAAAVCVLSISVGHIVLQGQAAISSQRPTVPFQTYDVVSVKSNTSTDPHMHLHTHDADFQATNISIKVLLTSAYGIREGLVVGLPKWAESSRWDVSAKISEPDTALMNRTLSNQESTAVYHAQVQDMLAQSFHLKAHYETDILPVYDLIVTRTGAKLTPSKLPESETGTDVHGYKMVASHLSMKLFGEALSKRLDRNVIDKTRLNGTYDFTLTWTPADRLDAAQDNGTSDLPPGIFTAVQEQLGLRLVPSKGPSEKLVVDSIEAPQSN